MFIECVIIDELGDTAPSATAEPVSGVSSPVSLSDETVAQLEDASVVQAAERSNVSPSPAIETVLLCIDGSGAAEQAADAGLALLKDARRVLVVTVVAETDPTLVSGVGIAGGVMSVDEFEELDREAAADGWAAAEHTAARLDVRDPEIHVLRGSPGQALCSFARALDARAIVMGSRGRGGVKRAFLGSVSDHVVRNAPCPVLITGPTR